MQPDICLASSVFGGLVGIVVGLGMLGYTFDKYLLRIAQALEAIRDELKKERI